MRVVEDNIEQLPTAYRLVLSYAPRETRLHSLALLTLDTRLARIGAQASEPMIAQLKLAWWRDQFGKDAVDWPKGEPLLGTLRELGFQGSDLAALVDGWEVVTVSETINEADVQALADGRSTAWATVDRMAGGSFGGDAVHEAATAWTAGELGATAGADEVIGALPRSLRALAVLGALGRRAKVMQRPMLDGPAAMLLAMRVGIFGR